MSHILSQQFLWQTATSGSLSVTRKRSTVIELWCNWVPEVPLITTTVWPQHRKSLPTGWEINVTIFGLAGSKGQNKRWINVKDHCTQPCGWCYRDKVNLHLQSMLQLWESVSNICSSTYSGQEGTLSCLGVVINQLLPGLKKWIGHMKIIILD